MLNRELFVHLKSISSPDYRLHIYFTSGSGHLKYNCTFFPFEMKELYMLGRFLYFTESMSRKVQLFNKTGSILRTWQLLDNNEPSPE